MLKLMKYEFKKTMFSKYVILAFTALLEVLFVMGVLTENNKMLSWGIAGLVIVALIGLFYIGMESIIVMHQDLNTKQSYMLFLTPRSSFQIIGAKILQNGFAIFLAGVVYGVLAIADFSFMVIKLDGIQELMDMVNYFLNQFHLEIHITRTEGFLGLFGGLSSWLGMIVNGYLAITICATFFAGRKLSGLISFLFYIIIVILEGRVLDILPEFSSISMKMGAMIGTNFIMIILAYLITCWIMERKLNV